MSHPSYDPIWIPVSLHMPEYGLPVAWKPYEYGANVPLKYIGLREDLPEMITNWCWAPTGIYRELAWENTYLRYCGL